MSVSQVLLITSGSTRSEAIDRNGGDLGHVALERVFSRQFAGVHANLPYVILGGIRGPPDWPAWRVTCPASTSLMFGSGA